LIRTRGSSKSKAVSFAEEDEAKNEGKEDE